MLFRAAFYCLFGAALAPLVSIAAAQILLALGALLLSGERLRLPPIWLPLPAFLAPTLISLALSGNAAAGRPQIRKCFVFVVLRVVFSTFRTRFLSLFQSQGELDSNQHLIVCWRTGVRMIRARPWFGLGPEMAGRGIPAVLAASFFELNLGDSEVLWPAATWRARRPCRIEGSCAPGFCCPRLLCWPPRLRRP